MRKLSACLLILGACASPLFGQEPTLPAPATPAPAVRTKSIPCVTPQGNVTLPGELRDCTVAIRGRSTYAKEALLVTDPATGATYFAPEPTVLIRLSHRLVGLHRVFSGSINYSLGANLPPAVLSTTPDAERWQALDKADLIVPALKDMHVLGLGRVDAALQGDREQMMEFPIESVQVAGDTVTLAITSRTHHHATLVIDASADQWKVTSETLDGKAVPMPSK